MIASPSVELPTLLLVDDEEDMLELMSQVVRREGFRVLSTTDPRAALGLLASEGPIDVLLTDVDMPQMNGIDLVLAAKRAHPLVVRLMLTGGSNLATALRAINEGEVFRYLVKPVDRDVLRVTLHEAVAHGAWLRRRAAEEQADSERAARLADLATRWPNIADVGERGARRVIDVAAIRALGERLGQTGTALLTAVLHELAGTPGAHDEG